MGADKFHIDPTRSVRHRNDQPVVVPSDIENDSSVSDEIGAPVPGVSERDDQFPLRRVLRCRSDRVTRGLSAGKIFACLATLEQEVKQAFEISFSRRRQLGDKAYRPSFLRVSQVFNGRLHNRARQTSLRRRRHHEGVQDLRTGAYEVGRIARHDGQIVKKRGGRNLLVQGVLGVRDS